MEDEAAPSGSESLIRKIIGRNFRTLREQAGMSQDEAVKATSVSKSTLVRLEKGQSGVRFNEVVTRHMLDVYGASPTERALLLGMTEDIHSNRSTSWWHNYTQTALPVWFVLYVTMEDAARRIRLYELELVPGLLQTRAYADQVIRTPGVNDDEEERARRVNVRIQRQSLLTRKEAPQLDVILNEAVLHRTIGAGSLAREQLQHLLDVSHQPNIDLRILPWTAGIHGGMSSTGGFSALSFPTDPSTHEALEPPLIYIEAPTGAMYLTKDSEVAIYDRIWESMLQSAFDPQASRLAITHAMEGLAT